VIVKAAWFLALDLHHGTLPDALTRKWKSHRVTKRFFEESAPLS
jgi:hypothetical protein